MDFESGYYQIGMDANSGKLTAFLWEYGLYEWTRMPMVFKNIQTILRCLRYRNKFSPNPTRRQWRLETTHLLLYILAKPNADIEPAR